MVALTIPHVVPPTLHLQCIIIGTFLWDIVYHLSQPQVICYCLSHRLRVLSVFQFRTQTHQLVTISIIIWPIKL